MEGNLLFVNPSKREGFSVGHVSLRCPCQTGLFALESVLDDFKRRGRRQKSLEVLDPEAESGFMH